MRFFAASDLQRNSAEIQKAALLGPVFLTYHDKPRYVMMSLEEFARIQGKEITEDLTGNPQAAAAPVRKSAKAARPAKRTPKTAPSAVDKLDVDELVLARVNAPYQRRIDAATLRGCLTNHDLDRWLVHVATFFNGVAPELVFEFADQHGISRSALTQAYLEMRRKTGERNTKLEDHLVAMASASRASDRRSHASSRKRKR